MWNIYFSPFSRQIFLSLSLHGKFSYRHLLSLDTIHNFMRLAHARFSEGDALGSCFRWLITKSRPDQALSSPRIGLKDKAPAGEESFRCNSATSLN